MLAKMFDLPQTFNPFSETLETKHHEEIILLSAELMECSEERMDSENVTKMMRLTLELQERLLKLET